MSIKLEQKFYRWNPYFYQAFPIVSLVVMRLYYRQSHLVVMLTRTFIIFLLIEASIDKR